MISGRQRRLERRLKEERPEAPGTLVRAISGRVGVRRTGVPRLALGGAMTALMLVALGSVGGISYAANAAKEAAKIVQKAVSPSGAITVSGISSGGDQYRPGFGFGDPPPARALQLAHDTGARLQRAAGTVTEA